ncbi:MULTISPECIES: DUF3892 domain-containing protein [unclassified Polaromonas]|uniref:DUF3892 domain-containing protein n=1 Tax=unclassified Polaromonas TaxID=2638319 RepID=UPI000F074674|nr:MULTISPECIES: DUF3892 domain-containing protein [unclassified Polaromonas]AYQ27639.1 DUF3892 domain-containing protein [Polaromonas sp. SP1]QGJ17515.1 DUF3892 domain-containing protein [Polaromonas sp. Pch-P]
MAAWADYCISDVRYNAANTHIDKLIVRIHDGAKNTMGVGKEMTRPEAVKLLEQGKTFTSVTKNADGSFKKGAPVKVFPVEVKFLKTTPDQKESDNLDHLPRF